VEEKAYWYRVESRSVSDIDWEGEPAGSHMEISLCKLEVLKNTPKGVWLKQFMRDKKFVLREAHKRFACPTIAEAFESFRARRARQIRIFNTRIAEVNEALFRAKMLEDQIERNIVHA
jgi:hypothetical protein